jgi:UPF0755 protein
VRIGRNTQSGIFVARAALYLSVPLLSALCALFFFRSTFLTPVNPSDTKPRLFEIPPDSSVKTIAKSLEQGGYVKRWWAISYLSRMLGRDRRVSAGEYELSPSMTAVEILNKLVSGQTFERKVTFKEGASIWELGALLEEAGIISRAEFNAALTDRQLLTTAQIPSESFEGYLFPNTYFFSRPVTPRTIIFKMIEEGEGKWPDEFTNRADQLGLNRHQVLTLASIIEKESGNREEQPLVSSVFHNRLAKNMRLQSDPTVIYGIPEFNGDLTRADLERPSPYNTYTIDGLPPGPICNPGESAIRAALYPAETTYLYFVGDGQGAHVFSTTLTEHNAAVSRYQLGGGVPSLGAATMPPAVAPPEEATAPTNGKAAKR